jgi:putative copper resistance protein D
VSALLGTWGLTDPRKILISWVFDPWVVLGLGVALWWYVRALHRLQRGRGPRWPVSRSRAFIAGLGVLAFALLSPLDVYSDLLLSVHMVQHLLLTMVAPPLLLLGAPITLALRTESPPRRAALARILRSRTVQVVGNPLLGWILFAATVWASHLPAFYDATLRNVGLHAAEHLAYLSTALLFWRPLVGKDPGPRLSHPARLFAMFLIMPQMTFLGLAIYSSDRPLYAHYIATSLRFGTTAVADQHLGGAIMWSSGMLFMVPAMALVLIDWMRKDEREAARYDARALRAQEAANDAAARAAS